MTTDTGLTIEFEATGRTWEKVESFSIQDSFMVDADAWSATVHHDDPRELRRTFLPKSRVKLYVNETLQLVGRIEDTEDVRGSTSLRVVGTDYFGDLVAPGADPSLRISSGMTLEDALLEGFRAHGITTIETDLDEVVSRKMGQVKYRDEQRDVQLANYRAGSALQNQRTLIEALSPSVTVRVPIYEEVKDLRPLGTVGLLDWGQDLCSRFGATLQPGSERSALAVVSPDYSGEPRFHFHRSLDGGGNVSDAVARRHWGGVPTVAAFRGKFVDAEKRATNGWSLLSPVGDSELAFGQIDEVRRIFDNASAVEGYKTKTQPGNADAWYCPIFFKDRQSRSLAELEKSTRRTVADKLRGTLEYRCTLPAHGSNRAIFATNVLASVVDDISDIHETLWMLSEKSGTDTASTQLSNSSDQRAINCDCTLDRPRSLRAHLRDERPVGSVPRAYNRRQRSAGLRSRPDDGVSWADCSTGPSGRLWHSARRRHRNRGWRRGLRRRI